MAMPWLKKLFSRPAKVNPAARRKPTFRPGMERLEDRLVPVTGVTDLTVLTPQALVNTLVGGSGGSLTVSNITYTGANVAAGVFVGGKNSIGIDTGVVLSSGKANGIVGPNNAAISSTANGRPGDAQLDAIIAPIKSFDASILEFDFVPKGSMLTFSYVFGSEEYNTFVNTGFNDVFGFFINGQNVALVPGTSNPVTINTINNGTNSQFFVDNTTFTHPVHINGFTTVLPISVAVNAGQVNHIKLAIADGNDMILDSNVMIAGLSAVKIDTYRPLRYVFNHTTGTMDGNLTIVSRLSDVAGPNFAVLPSLPPNVTVANAAGSSGKTSSPFVPLPNGGALPIHKPSRPLVKFSNPSNVYLSSFFEAFPIVLASDVTGA